MSISALHEGQILCLTAIFTDETRTFRVGTKCTVVKRDGPLVNVRLRYGYRISVGKDLLKNMSKN